MTQLKLKLTKQKFKNLQTKQDGFIARVKSNGTAGFDEICELASTNTTVHVGEMAAAFRLALDAIAKALKQGMIVDLGTVGKLYPAVSSKWTATEAEQKIANVTAKVAYRPSQEIQAAIASAKLSWANGTDDNEADTTDADGSGSGDSTSTSSGNGSDEGGTSSDAGGSSDSGGANL